MILSNSCFFCFLVVFDDSWGFLVVLFGSVWFLVVFGFWYLVFGGSWQFLVVLVVLDGF